MGDPRANCLILHQVDLSYDLAKEFQAVSRLYGQVCKIWICDIILSYGSQATGLLY